MNLTTDTHYAASLRGLSWWARLLLAIDKLSLAPRPTGPCGVVIKGSAWRQYTNEASGEL